MLRAWVVVVLAGCGRIGFGTDVDADGGTTGSGSNDGTPAGFTIGQHASNDATVDPARVVVTLSEPVALGDVLLVAIDHSPKAGESITLTDARGSVFTKLMGPVGDAVIVEWLYVAPVTSAGVDQVTAVSSIAPDNFFEVRVHEIHGLRTDITGVTTASGNGHASPSDIISSAPIAVPPSSMIVGYGTAETALDPGVGFTTIETDFGDLFEYEVTAPGGNFAATATDLGGGDWVMSIAALPLQ